MESALSTYLDYYYGLEEPKFAVLVTGEWGVGKTFQVQRCLPDDKAIYVSLFGVGSVEAIYAEVFAAAVPMVAKANQSAGIFAEAAKMFGVPKGLAGLAPSLVGALSKRAISPDRVLIFDDLERSTLESDVLFGVINDYVERQGFRVVVIAHDEKLEGEFQDKKEKLFGQVIRAEPFVEEAFDCFLAELEVKKGEIVDEDKTEILQSFIKEHEYYILNIFEISEVKSLRILRHCLHDLKRLYECLSDEHLAHDEVMAHLVQLFVAFDCEVRAENLGEADLRGREMKALASYPKKETKEKPWPPFFRAYQKYKPLDLSTDFLSDDVLVSMFCHGRFDEEQIHTSLNNAQFFVLRINPPDWKIVRHFQNLNHEVVENAFKEIEKRFEKLEITHPGELLHVFSLMLFFEKEGFYESISNVSDKCRKYIGDLKDKGAFCSPDYNGVPLNDYIGGYDGVSYSFHTLRYDSDIPEGDPNFADYRNSKPFRRLYECLEEQSISGFEAQYANIAKEVTCLIRDDYRAFCIIISLEEAALNRNYYGAFLKACDPKEFVDFLLSIPAEIQNVVFSALSLRYSGNKLLKGLGDEKAFATGLHDTLLEYADKAQRFEKLRIKQLVRLHLTGHIPRQIIESSADHEASS